MRSVALSTIALAATIRTSTAASCEAKDNVKITFYGWPDNSPPGPDNAFDCGRGKGPDGTPIAGGTGTYADPISFATATDNNYFPQCGIVYVPSLRKYFRNEDDCAECTTDFHNGAFHIDLWTGSNTKGGGDTQVSCENSLPGGQLTIIKEPPSSLPVDTKAFFDPDSSSCYKTTYPVTDESGLCSGGGGSSGSTASGSSSVTSKAVSSTGTSPVTSPTVPGSANTTPVPTTLVTQTSVTSPGSSSGAGSGNGGCTWEGHCLGSPCQTYDDCDGSNICGPDGTCVAL